MPLDARIPVILAGPDQAGTEDALLTEGDHPLAAARFTPAVASANPKGCLCCAPRNAAGQALTALFQGRARGVTPFFRSVIVSTLTRAGRAEVEAALDGDPVASACFRLIAEGGC